MVFTLCALLWANGSRAAEIRICAAASMTDAVRHLGREFQLLHPASRLVFNFASSGALAKQITSGAPTDIYISANQKWLDYVQQQGGLSSQYKAVLTYNSLVFIGRQSPAVTSIYDLPRVRLLAMASPRSAPAGQYAAQAMQAAGVYGQLQKAAKLVIGKDVRQALIYAEQGEVDGAFVYGSDARLARRSVVLFTVPSSLHDPIIYPVALTTAGERKALARDFYKFLLSGHGREILQQYGFGRQN